MAIVPAQNSALPPSTRCGSIARTQTLLRGLDMLTSLKDGALSMDELVERTGLSRATAYRLARAMVDRKFLSASPRRGFKLGPRMLQLGYGAQMQLDLTQLSRPHLTVLNAQAGGVAHLTRRDGLHAICVGSVCGQARLNVVRRIGDRSLLHETACGSVLILDRAPGISCTAQFEGDDVYGVAAPVRNVEGRIIAAVGVSQPARGVTNAKAAEWRHLVQASALSISIDCGWSDDDR